jgi:hypothetical protein
MKRFALVGALVAMAAAVALGPAGDAGAASKTVMVRVTATPRIPSGAHPIGAVSPSTTETGAVVLKPRDEGALTSFIASVTAAGSSNFHHYLAPGQFESRFGPTRTTIDAVKSQLAADRLQVTKVAGDGLLVEFRGTASNTESAFQTGLTSYKLANGTTGQATSSAVSLPSSIASQVSSVIGLDSLVEPQALDVERGSLARAKAHPAAKSAQFSHPPGSPDACSDASADAAELGGLTDDQIANSYGAFGLYKQGDVGAGQHIAIYELEPFLPSDIKTFDTCYFGASTANQMAGRLHVIPVDGGQPTGPGSGEAILDVEDVSALAPGATIDVYEAPNNVFDNSDFGSLDDYATIVNDDQDQVVSTSWGLCEQAVQQGEPGIQEAENFLFEQAAAQGQSIFSAAGDTGDDDCNENRASAPPAGQNVLSVDDPSSQPYVVAAGGTTITDATEPPTEQVWNDGNAGGGGGGGISESWAMPGWQLNSKVPGITATLPGGPDYTNANDVETKYGFPTGFCESTISGATSATPCRTLPDVSAQADEYTGAITIYSESFVSFAPDGWITIGGTSSAAPLWAAMLADVNASASCQDNPATTNGVGFVNPLLYGVASSPAADKASFTDVTAGNNDIYGLDNGLVFPATKGYDLASGLGSPQLTGVNGTAGLAYYLCSYATRASRPGVSDISPTQVSTSGGTITITGSGFESGGSSRVTGIEVGSTELTSSQFSVTSASTITADLPAAIDTLPPGSAAPQDGAGPVDIIVSLRNGQSSEPGPASTIEYVDESSGQGVPSITGLSPTGGSQLSPTPVTILGSDFTGATKVTFGGVAATSFTVISPSEIRVTPPAYSGSTVCAPSPQGESPATDLCQSQVQVTNPQGASAEGTILSPLEGTLPALNSEGVFDLPPSCSCEQEPAPTEFDYAPAPTVTAISTSPADPSSLASEDGGTLITVTGTGFNLLTLDWADIGDPTQAASQDFTETFVSGTEIQIVVPPTATTTDSTTQPFSVKTLAGASNSLPVTYAGVPVVSGVVNALTGSGGAADTGGTPISITGQGFDDAIAPIEFVDSTSPTSPASIGTQYTFTVNSDTSISTETVGQNPALVDTEVCSVTACSTASSADQLLLYPPGNPKVTSISPTSGPAAGGTPVVISGQNLGCVTGVFFGGVPATSVTNQQAILDCGSTSTVDATAPAGKLGKSVKVKVTTVESDLTGSGPSRSSARFKYTN